MKKSLCYSTLIFAMLFCSNTMFAQSNKIATDVKPFKIQIADAEIKDLKARIAATRWPEQVEGAGWDYGADSEHLKSLCAYWQQGFDWKKQEKYLNQFRQFKVNIDSVDVHFIYEKGKGTQSTPIVLLHGWPSTFLQMYEIIPLLTKPDEQGHSFDVIVPSLIGYGFSGKALKKGMNVYQIGAIFHKLMTEKLGYDRFMLRGSDIGAGVAKEWALSQPSSIIGLHLSGSNPYIYQMPPNLSEAEQKFTANAQQFMQTEGAYAMEQSTKPQSLAYGLNDSPVGLAAWIVEKFKTWSDNNGILENAFTKDELLTNISLYWFSRSIGSSMRLYYESAHAWSPNGFNRVETPTAFLMLKHDIAVAPREWEERSYNVVRWNENEQGGHFGEWEQPNILSRDIIEFRKALR